jgi:hypothetical protein
MFVVPMNGRLILGDEKPLVPEHMQITMLYEFANGFLKEHFVMLAGTLFTKVETAKYVEYVAYPNIIRENWNLNIGAVVRIPAARDRIIVRPNIDFDLVGAVQIKEYDLKEGDTLGETKGMEHVGRIFNSTRLSLY